MAGVVKRPFSLPPRLPIQGQMTAMETKQGPVMVKHWRQINQVAPPVRGNVEEKLPFRAASFLPLPPGKPQKERAQIQAQPLPASPFSCLTAAEKTTTVAPLLGKRVGGRRWDYGTG